VNAAAAKSEPELARLRRSVQVKQLRLETMLADDHRRVAPQHAWRTMRDWLHWSGLPHADHPEADQESLTAVAGFLDLWLSVSDLGALASRLWSDSPMEDDQAAA
jgi:hypothetical protein